jgi:hypothetical protein
MEGIRIKFIGDEHFINAIKETAANNPNELQIVSEQLETDMTRLGFDFVVAAAIVTIINHSTAIADRFMEWREKSQGNKVMVESTARTVEFRKDRPIDSEKVKNIFATIEDDEG